MVRYNKVCVNDYDIREILHMIREWSGLTQEELARSVGRTRDSINNIENGRNKMSIDEFFYMCNKHHIIVILEKR